MKAHQAEVTVIATAITLKIGDKVYEVSGETRESW